MKKHFLKKVTFEAPRARWQAGQEGAGRVRELLIQTEGGCSVSLWLQMKQMLHSQRCLVT